MPYTDPLFGDVHDAEIIKLAKKEFLDVARVYYFLSKQHAEDRETIDKSLKSLNALISLFNKKYSGIKLKLLETHEQLRLRVLIPGEKDLKAFFQAASRLNGMKSIGADSFGRASMLNQDIFMNELDKAKKRLYVKYFEQEDYTPEFVAELNKKDNAIELQCDAMDLIHDTHPIVKLCVYYMAKGKIRKGIDLAGKAVGFGFTRLDELDSYLASWNPKMDE